jgi:hypothetical protein
MTDTTQPVTVDPIIIHTIRRDLARTPDGRGGLMAYTPATPGKGGTGMYGDYVLLSYEEALAPGIRAQTALAAVRAIHTRTEVDALAPECNREDGTCQHGTPGHADDCPAIPLGVCSGCMAITEDMGGFDETIPGTIVWPCATIKAIEAALA